MNWALVVGCVVTIIFAILFRAGAGPRLPPVPSKPKPRRRRRYD